MQATSIFHDDVLDASSYFLKSAVDRVTREDVEFIVDLRARIEQLQLGARMLMNINDARRLTAFVNSPMYRGRNSTYVSFEPYQVRKWLTLAEQKIATAVASKFDRA
jgi:hypothetical protein